MSDLTVYNISLQYRVRLTRCCKLINFLCLIHKNVRQNAGYTVAAYFKQPRRSHTTLSLPRRFFVSEYMVLYMY